MLQHPVPKARPSANASAVDGGVAIRPLTALDDYATCVEIQRAVWAWADLDLVPIRLLVLMQHVGGLVLGAQEDDQLVGFVNCVPGIEAGQVFWHSHMMAVLPEYRNRGIGTALKLAQRAYARERGIGTIRWVFDPLEAKNAYLNIAKLGVTVRRYSINHYGRSTSRLHAGLDTDRVIAEWDLTTTRAPVDGGEIRRVRVPADAQALRRDDLPAARALQLAVRTRFLRNLADRFVVIGCERYLNGIEYVFQREPQP